MSLTVSLSGNDSFQLNNQVLSTLANDKPVDVTFPNELAAVSQGKNGTTIYAQNSMGNVAEVVLRLLLGGVDDKYLNSILQQQQTNFSGFSLMTSVFSKLVGDGNGNITTVIYQLSGGIIMKGLEAATSATGDVNTSVVVWPLKFGNWVRIIA